MVGIIILFLIILSVLVFVHELGHFVTARRNGMRVDEFGFGFPPRMGGIVKDKETGKWKFLWGNKVDTIKDQTIYSINWIPLGGFVRIKGEDGEGREDSDSFASKSAWARIKVLAAGVFMNFVLAWFIFIAVFAIGAPTAVEDDAPTPRGASVQIGQVVEGSPAESMGLQIGDEVSRVSAEGGDWIDIDKVVPLQEFIASHKGEEVSMEITRGDETVLLSGTPRVDYPAEEGSLGVQLMRITTVKYSLNNAIWEGLAKTGEMTWLILKAFGGLVGSLAVGDKEGLKDVAGPVGIAYITKQVSDLGFIYILQFTAMLSINLGIINILPIPALDGGRIVFVLLEVLRRGKPVSKKFEQMAHGIGFMALMLLMVIITFHDFIKFNIVDKFIGLF